MRLRNLDSQVESLTDENGQLVQYDGSYPPVVTKVDITSGAKLWMLGDELRTSVWQDPALNPAGTGKDWAKPDTAVETPPNLPEGLVKATRFSPSPIQPHTPGQRPRSQLHLSHEAIADQAALDADPTLLEVPDSSLNPYGLHYTGVPVTGFVGTDHPYLDYIWVPPSYPDTVDVQRADALVDRPPTLTHAWHGMVQGDSGFPIMQAALRRTPDREGPIHWTLMITAGRTWLNSGPPPWPYDYDVLLKNGPGPVEIRREFYLSDPDGGGFEFGTWHKLVIRQKQHYAIGTAITEAWVDGVKMVGQGGVNREIAQDPKIRRTPDPGRPNLGDYSSIPNLFLDVAGPQQSRCAMYCYVSNEGLDANHPEDYNWRIWNRAVWRTGGGFFSTLEETNPTVPAAIVPPHAHELTPVLAPSTTRRIAAPSVEEQVPVQGPASLQHARPWVRENDVWHRLPVRPPGS